MIKSSFISVSILCCCLLLFNVVKAQDSVFVKKDSVALRNTLPKNVDSTKSIQLQQFRKFFNKVVDSKKIKQKKKVKKDPKLDLAGIVLDETRSKLGRNFYDLFYQEWVPPKNMPDFTITISEQPTPFLGTQIGITINYQRVFSAQLQPRYEYIKAVSKQAVARCRQIVQQEASVRKQLSGY